MIFFIFLLGKLKKTQNSNKVKNGCTHSRIRKPLMKYIGHWHVLLKNIFPANACVFSPWKLATKGGQCTSVFFLGTVIWTIEWWQWPPWPWPLQWLSDDLDDTYDTYIAHSKVPIICMYLSYYTSWYNFWWIVLFIFITVLLFLLYVLSSKNVDHTVFLILAAKPHPISFPGNFC